MLWESQDLAGGRLTAARLDVPQRHTRVDEWHVVAVASVSGELV